MTPEQLRSKFLINANEILDEMNRRVLGLPSKYPAADTNVLNRQWQTIERLILETEDLLSLDSFSDGPFAERVDYVMEAVANGTITISQGKRLIAMLQAGFEIAELPGLIDKLESLENAD